MSNHPADKKRLTRRIAFLFFALISAVSPVLCNPPTSFVSGLGTAVAPPQAQSDLVIQSLSVNPTSGPAGSSFTVSFTIRNQGAATANTSTTNIRLGTSSTSVTTSDPLLASISTPSIAAGASNSVSRSVTVPSGSSAGARRVWVILDVNSTANQSNESNDKANTSFSITAASSAPAITSVSPNPVTGSNSSQSFTINGSGFTSQSTVTLRDKSTGEVFSNRAISSQTSTRIVINPVFTTAAHSWSVEVLNGTLSSGQFNFQVVAPAVSPTISSVSPNPVTGSNNSQPFTINGSGFTSSSAVTLRDKSTGEVFTNRPISSRTSTRIVINPVFTTAAHNWSVEVLNGTLSSGQFNFQVIAPAQLPGSFSLTNNAPVCDTNPPAAPALRLNWTSSSAATSYDVYRNGSLYAPGLPGTTYYNSLGVVAGQTYSYFVRARNGAGATDSNSITVSIPSNICASASPPNISNISPSNVTVNQATTLTVNGSNFQSGFSASVTTSLGTFNIAGAGLTFVSSAQVRVQVTMGGTPPFVATLRITNPNGQSATGTFTVSSQQSLPGGLTLSNQAPVCDTNLPVAPAVRLNWTASNGAASYDVYRNGSVYSVSVAGTSFYNSANVIAGQTYTYFVRAKNSAGTTDSNTITVAVPSNICSTLVPSPVINRITPSNVVVNQTTTLTVTGSNFQSNFRVTVQGDPVDASGLRFVSSNEVSVSVRMGGTPPYPATLVLTNVSDGQSASGSFTVASAASAPLSPTAAYTYSPTSALVGQPIQFTDGSSGQTLSWEWDFNGDGAADSRVQNPSFTFNTTGPRQVRLQVSNAYGVDSITKTLSVGTAGGSAPVITDVIRKYQGAFLAGSGIDNTFDVRVDWKGNPGTVSFSVNGGTPIIEGGTTLGATHTFNMERDFPARQSASTIIITATNAAGVASAASTQQLYIFPHPTWLQQAIARDPTSLRGSPGGSGWNFSFGLEFPVPHLGDEDRKLPDFLAPILGRRFGPTETFGRINGQVSSTGSGRLDVFGQMGFEVMDQAVEGRIGGGGQFRLGPPDGLKLTGASFGGALRGTLTTRKRILSIFPVLDKAAIVFPPLRWFNERATIDFEASPRVDIAFNFQQDAGGDLKFSEGTGTGGLDLRAILRVPVIEKRLTARAWVGGGAEMTLGVPRPFLRKGKFSFQPGIDVTVDFWGVRFCPQATYTWACTWEPGLGWECGKGGDYDENCDKTSSQNSILAPNGARGMAGLSGGIPLSPIKHDYQRFGSYSAFRPAGNKAKFLSRPASSKIPLTVQESALLDNVFPGAAPFLLGTGNGSVLLWVHQDPALPVSQSTDISWSYNPGDGNWTPPALVLDDTRADLSPVAGVDGSGKVIGAWLRIKDSNFNLPIGTAADLPLFYNRLDIVSAIFDPATRAWGAVSQVTDDSAFDTSLRLSSDDAGHLLLTWLSNPGGEFTSNTASPSTAKYSFWNGSAWAPPAVLASDLVGVSTGVAAVKGSAAFAIISRDPNPAVEGDGVLDLYRWSGSAWSAPATFAAGGVDNRLPSSVYTADGEGHVVWLKGNDLVHATLSEPTPRVVRAGSTSMAFYNVQLISNSQGNLTLVWQEVVDNGPANIFAMLYDPATQTWSADRRLSEDQSLAHDVGGYYDRSGQLHLAYLATQITRTSETVVVDGETHTINNIPQDGRTDLRLLSHSLINDLALTDADLSINLQQPGEGEAVVASVDVHNAGDFAVDDFVVNLYVGDPAVSGNLVGSAAVTDLLRAGDHRVLSFNFNMPARGGNIVAVVDANNSVTEFTKSNNRATFYLNNSAPQARVAANVTGGTAPLTVNFDASPSFDTEGDSMSFAWVFADGSPSANGATASHTFNQPGVYAVTVAVTDAHGAVGTAVVTVTVNPARAVQFNTAFYDVGEGSGSVVATITRVGDLSGPAAVDYTTAGGTASDRSDYTTARGTMRFAPGESTKTFPIFLTDDTFVEGPETINVVLTNPSGLGLGFPSTTVVSVSDNDGAAGQANPIDDARYFVRQHYLDFLNREADEAGLSFWANEITSCGSNVQCVELKKVNVSAAFFLSIEFQETGFLAYRMYKAAYGDATSPGVAGTVPIIRLQEFLADAQAIGRGVRVGVGNWQQQLEDNKQALATDFVGRPRFLSALPSTLNPTQFVDALNANAGGALSQAERDALVNDLSAGTKTRAQVLREVAEDQTLKEVELNRAFVLMQYYGYMRRNPDDPQDTDFRGWKFWLDKLDEFNGNFVRAQMVKAFLDSIEYRQRFGQ